MEQQRWQLIEAIFEQALEKDSNSRREFLESACGGDHALLEDLEELLSHHGVAEGQGFLDGRSGAGQVLPIAADVKDPYIGMELGPYVVKRRQASGGMGNVYLAARQADFRQQVAIKVLRRGMDSEDILRRFRNEIQVLAALSKHPNIAALLDAGTTKDGLPFFVMEFVDGEPLDSYCDKHRLSIRERIELFLRVCAAVDYAHQHMIIHRDLKMSNILVRADGVAKLIDFGIAKLTAPELGTQTMTPTMPERRFMTAEYASPEQARGQSLTSASDVYSLGVTLYELVAGRKPYTLSGCPPIEQARIICEYEPDPPSKSLSQNKSSIAAPGRSGGPPDLNEISIQRDTTPTKLKRQLAGDMDNIVLKALRKDPRQRYATAASLAADLKCFLEGSQVHARPIGKAEQVYRWCRRNPVPTALLFTVVVTLVAGLWQLSRLSDQLVRSTAVGGAALEAETLAMVQDFYSKVVVDKVRGKVPVTHRYAVVEGAIPVPASFTIDLGEHLRQSRVTGMFMRLYSDFPFRHRDGGGARDNFEEMALRRLRQNPDRPFYRFEPFEGRPSLRYATARVMQQSCVNCHNTHPDSTKKDWKVGDVRGVLEIIRPLDADIARTQKNLRETSYFMGGISVLLIALALFFLRVGKNR